MEEGKIKKEGIKTKLLLLLLNGIRRLLRNDKELHLIRIVIVLKENPDSTKVGSFKLKFIIDQP